MSSSNIINPFPSDQSIHDQVKATHKPEGRGGVLKMGPLLYISENIFRQCAALSVPAGSDEGSAQVPHPLDDSDPHSYIFYTTLLPAVINKVSYKILCADANEKHKATLKILDTLSMYEWDEKVLLAIAVFAITYGNSRLFEQICPTNSLATSISMLKQDLNLTADTLKSSEINDLIRAMLDVAKCVGKFKELPFQYITSGKQERINYVIRTAIYWTIKSIVACTTQFTGGLAHLGSGDERFPSTSELHELAYNVKRRLEHLQEQLNDCYKIIDEQKYIETYQELVKIMEAPSKVDTMQVLKALIYAKDDQPPLVIGDSSNRKTASLDVLKRKDVLLLITDLNVSHGELFILEQIYQESRQQSTRDASQYEVVWLPVVDRATPLTEIKEPQFESIRKTMPWYSIYHPSMVDPAVTRYIKEFWHFEKKPILVVLDLQRIVVNTNALHMMWIWGSAAFPFTSSREKDLWREESWTLELLAYSLDPAIPLWISEGKNVCLYGGEDTIWIRKFTMTAQAVARAAGIVLELLYVGKSNPKEKVKRNVDMILAVENLGHTLQDIPLIWFFWVRLESMWHSKMKDGKNAEPDPITQEIVTMLSFDGNDEGWAVIFSGNDMVKAKGETILRCFGDYELWKSQANRVGFIPAIKDHLQELHTPQHCNRLILPGTTGIMPERIVCAECGQPMEQFIMYNCCKD